MLLVEVATELIESVIAVPPMVVEVALDTVVVTRLATVLCVELVPGDVGSVTVSVKLVVLSSLLPVLSLSNELVTFETVVVTNSVTVLRVGVEAGWVDTVTVSPTPDVAVSNSVPSVEVEDSKDRVSPIVVAVVVTDLVFEVSAAVTELLVNIDPVCVLEKSTVSVSSVLVTVDIRVEVRVPLTTRVPVSVILELSDGDV